MTRGRVWNDRALESPRAGWIITGLGCSFALLGVLLLAVGVAAGAAWWVFALLALWPPLVGLMLYTGARERARARAHRDSMRAYGESITASFEKLLEERGRHQ